MNKRFVLLAFASVFLLSAVIGSQLIVSVAAPLNVGVSPGDWAEYDCYPSGNGTMPAEMNMTWAKITVLDVLGTNITYQDITRYANTSELTYTYWLDVTTGQATNPFASGVFIAANLTAGDLIYTSPPPYGPIPPGATINETIWRTYPVVGTVEVNHLNTTDTWTVDTTVVTQSLNYYWYRATGILAEVSIYQIEQPDVGPPTWIKLEVVTFDIIPEFPPALILPLFMIATLTTVWLGKKIWSTKKSIKKPSPCT